ncbi:cysteine-rich venom protein-like [Discoglossus pictus]
MKLFAVLCVLGFYIHLSIQAGLPLSTLQPKNATVRKIILDLHNWYRRQVSPNATNMLRIRWSEEAAKSAERWARTCNLTSSPPEERKIPNFLCGENVFMTTFKVPWDYVLEAFASESEDFVYGKGPKSVRVMVNHYLQMINYNTYMVGCAIEECPASEVIYFYVCHYCPGAANITSLTTPYKSGKLCDSCRGKCDRGLCTNPCKYQDFMEKCDESKSLCITDRTIQEKCPATCNCKRNEIK